MLVSRVWGTQNTVDEIYVLDDEKIKDIIVQLMNEKPLEKTKGSFQKIISGIDTHVQADDEIKNLNFDQFSLIEKLIHEYTCSNTTKIGGSPAISAISDYMYNSDFEHVGFLGNTTDSLSKGLESSEKNERYRFLFSNNNKTTHKPKTLSLESSSGRYKIMIPYSSGRNLSELDADNVIRRSRRYAKNGGIMFGLGGLNKGSAKEYHKLLNRMQEEISNMYLFVGTNSFKGLSPMTKMEYLSVCYRADIVSFNDEELKQVYTALGGEKDIPLSEMLSDLDKKAQENNIVINPNQIKVCHAKSGAVIFPSSCYEKIPSDVYSSTLNEAVKATSLSFKLDADISRDFVHKLDFLFGTDQSHEFTSMFGKTNLPYAVAPLVTSPLGNTTGLGAKFDGILASRLASYLPEYRR
jgi:hypothetical protein